VLCCSTKSRRATPTRRIFWNRPCVSIPTQRTVLNALGIAYLEQAQFDKALPAFRDAAKRAQHWSYPLHNAALASVETGDYKSAIKYYQQAIKLTPQYSYLHYNLGLVYQRLNRNKDAENAYREAMKRASNSAEPSNALGTLKAAQGKRSEAEQFYKDALAKNPKLYSARHNLALLLASTRIDSRRGSTCGARICASRRASPRRS
jgi:Flp pilus assembly protein TadD